METSPISSLEDSISGISQYISPIRGLSTLELLPRELMWKIIERAPEVVSNLRLTSRVIRSIVDEHAQLQINIPIIDEITFEWEYKEWIYGFMPGKISVSIKVSECTVSMFELRLKLNKHRFDFTNSDTPRFCGNVAEFNISMREYKIQYNANFHDDSFFSYLKHCMGRRIGKVIIEECNEHILLEAISKIIKGIDFAKLKIKHFQDPLSTKFGEFLLRAIKSHKVDHLSLSVYIVDSACRPAILLKDLSSLVKSIYITQQRVARMNGTTYLFGLHNADWASIIIGILNILRKLPLLGKPIWFMATCECYENELKQQSNEFIVRADDNRKYSPNMRITHTSRKNELSTFF